MTKVTSIFVLAAFASATAYAQTAYPQSQSAYARDEAMTYTYIEGAYAHTDTDDGLDIDGDGLDVAGSFALTDTLFLTGGYTSRDFDFGIDLDRYEAGLGGHLPLAPNLDVVGTVSYLHSEEDFAFGDADDDGIGLALGLRGRLTDALELQGGLSYADLDDFTDDLALNIGGRYYMTPQLALGAGFEAGDDVSTWTVGLRYEFR